MKKVVFVAVSLALCSATGAAGQAGPADATRSVTARAATGCARRPISFFQLAAELARVQPPCGARLECVRGNWGNLETKELAGYTLSNWLWSGPGPRTFSVAEQDGFIAAARARAQAARPPTKQVRIVSYFTDFLVGSGGAYFVGARATYGNCVGNTRPTPS
jgi:hypothetical protein